MGGEERRGEERRGEDECMMDAVGRFSPVFIKDTGLTCYTLSILLGFCHCVMSVT